LAGTHEHVIELPKRIVVGSGVLKSVGKVFRSLQLNEPILIVTGPHVGRTYADLLVGPLEEAGYREIHMFIARDATRTTAENAASTAKEYKVKTIIGFGGGKSIDIAKYAAYMTDSAFVSIPTAASHDGIASPFASLKGISRPHSIKARTPIAIIADTRIIAKAPHRLLIAGAGDLIAKLTAVRDWRLAHRLKGEYYGEYAASLALLSAKHVIKYASIIRHGGEKAARIVVEGLISSGVAMCIAGSTRPASGSEHLFSHALDLLAPKPALHGEQVALGTIMMMYLHGGNWRAVRVTMKRLGLPVTAKELGIEDSIIIKALTMAHSIRPERYTILGETGLTWEAAEKLARVAKVIE